jgi:hypothetical protein
MTIKLRQVYICDCCGKEYTETKEDFILELFHDDLASYRKNVYVCDKCLRIIVKRLLGSYKTIDVPACIYYQVVDWKEDN